MSHQKRNENRKKTKDDIMNLVTREIHDALFLVVDNPVDHWVLDLRALFHITSNQEIM